MNIDPVPLSSGHILSGFECRSQEQTDWLHQHARQAHASGTTRVFVVAGEDDTVIAYYAWCMASVGDLTCLPPRMRKGTGRYPQPVALLARLGVDIRYEGRGLGAVLLNDVMTRLLGLSDEIGCRGLPIHCETDDAKKFYLHLVPAFTASPTDPMHLYLLLKDIRQSLQP
ncbi:GNAT family N-acetyltransferase [Trebonia sp.]|uniref:GNAT family N-acetyltransferase n=1 Tax=Trebonia sp. TaxID=2767075 RepID=UPI002619C78F|nr:GNAT family N-acetyltransferase [Trebonia sp.]